MPAQAVARQEVPDYAVAVDGRHRCFCGGASQHVCSRRISTFALKQPVRPLQLYLHFLGHACYRREWTRDQCASRRGTRGSASVRRAAASPRRASIRPQTAVAATTSCLQGPPIQPTPCLCSRGTNCPSASAGGSRARCTRGTTRAGTRPSACAARRQRTTRRASPLRPGQQTILRTTTRMTRTARTAAAGGPPPWPRGAGASASCGKRQQLLGSRAATQPRISQIPRAPRAPEQQQLLPAPRGSGCPSAGCARSPTARWRSA